MGGGPQWLQLGLSSCVPQPSGMLLLQTLPYLASSLRFLVEATLPCPRPVPRRPTPPPRANYFLALQVSQAPAVVAAIQRVQAAVSKHSPHLKKACVDAASSHLTLVSLAAAGRRSGGGALDAIMLLAGGCSLLPDCMVACMHGLFL